MRHSSVGRLLSSLFICAICAICGSSLFAADGALELFSASPAAFIENTGQIADPAVRYVFHGSGASVYHTTSGPVFQVFQRMDRMDGRGGRGGAGRDALAFSACFPGASAVQPEGAELQRAMVNYYIGEPSAWRANVPTFGKVVYRGLYEGIDLHTFGRRSSLKYEFHSGPGARWERIAVRYAGIDGLRIDSAGAMHVSTALGELVDDAPFAYQVIDGKQVRVACRYRLIDRMTYGFEITDEVNAERELVIDPDLAWASFLGGSGVDFGSGIAADADGNALVTGGTASSDFPTPGGFDTTHNGGDYDAFVAKVSPSCQLLWASYLGGNESDSGRGIAADADGNALITGNTTSRDFPTPGGFDRTSNGGGDAFVAKVSPSCQLLWASYLGGNQSDSVAGIAADADSDALITGSTSSGDFPTPGGFDTTHSSGYRDAFAAKVSATGQLLWASYLGGSHDDSGSGITADGHGNVLITGSTFSGDFPTPGGFDTTLGSSEAFVAKVWLVPLLNVRSVAVTGVSIMGDKPGTTNYTAECLKGQDISLTAPAMHRTPGGVRYNFVKWTVDGAEQPGNTASITMDTDHTAVAIYQMQTWTAAVQSSPITGVSVTGDNPGNTNYAAICNDQQSVTVTAPPLVSAGGGDYDFVRWTLDGANLPHGQTSISVTMDADHAVVAVYEVRPWRLTVQSFLSVPIGGDVTGVTDYSAWCRAGQVVNLTAPRTVNYQGANYCFTRWRVDGVPIAAGEVVISVTMNSDHTASADYDICEWTLTVQSFPIAGAVITGDRSGTTTFIAGCNDGGSVQLTAPATLSVGGKTWHFAYWLIGNAAQPRYRRDAYITMDRDVKATAVYDPAIRGDVNGDCRVNVLDLIDARNRLGNACSE